MKKFTYVSVLSCVITLICFGQSRDYKVHSRGMLHQTVYNTGELGRAWMTGSAGNETALPLMEWPSYSASILNGVNYSGQHNSIGAGVWLAANPVGKVGPNNRQFAFCGAVGAGIPEVAFGLWSFPYSIKRIENFPILSDGSLNSKYDPNEAEEIIIASWATSLGIKVTRTSRAYSYPDYDDFIINEYDYVYNGDTDGDTTTIERTEEWRDVQFAFVYGLGPSMYGYQRNYNEWKYDLGLYKGDQDQYWDPDYWLSFNMDRQTALDPTLAGKPEPDSTLFGVNARTGANGGGLLSPQAVGFAMLNYDTLHLAYVGITSGDVALNESESNMMIMGNPVQLDARSRVLQPWSNRLQTGDVNSIKMTTGEMITSTRSASVSVKYPPKVVMPWYPQTKIDAYKLYWKGRSNFNYGNTSMAVRKNIIFGPYTVRIGDTLRFTTAEVAGYGAEPNKPVEGGRDTTGTGTAAAWNGAPHWYRPAYSFDKFHNRFKMTDNYVGTYGYPDYVNSKVRNVMQVTHKAFEAYTGYDSIALKNLLPLKPEKLPIKGVYKNIPVPPPAPGINLANTDSGNVIITWNQNAELFTHPKLTGKPHHYNVYRSRTGMGPWKLVGTKVAVQDVGVGGLYRVNDFDSGLPVGESAYWAVTSVDSSGKESGKTNSILFQKNIGAVNNMSKVYAVPNPFIGKSGFSGSGNVDEKIAFYGLPKKCTIRIFSFAGNLVQTIEHDANLYTQEYFQVTRNGQEIASGIYFYVVTTPAGEKFSGKMVVIK